MDNFAEEFHTKLAYFKDRFPQPEYEIAVTVFHSLYHGVSYLHTIDHVLEGFGFGDEVQDCSFPFTEDQEDYHGVKFVRDLTWGDENSTDYWENIVPFNVFLDMLRSSVEWHLRKSPADENLLLHYFHERNLALRLDGSDFPNQDNAETWWRKCDEKRILHRSLRGMAQIDDPMQSEIDSFFVYLPEHLMLDFLSAATQRQNYESCFGKRCEDLTAQKITLNVTFYRSVLLDFSDSNKVRFITMTQTKSEEPKAENQITLSNQTFDTLLQAVASAYAERRPQFAREVAELMNNRIR